MSGFLLQCIVGCIFYSVGLIIPRKSPCIITKYKITHYQYPILHNREFRSLGNRKNYLKSTKATLQGNDVQVYLCLHCTYHHFDQVVSSECVIFGTPV
jgi:hypothetical protein